MALLSIEYRHSGKVRLAPDVRRTTEGMARYLESLVREMRSARISAEYVDSVAVEGESNAVFINGVDVRRILDGLRIIPLDGEDHCDLPGRPRMVSFGRPPTDWNRDHIEDIPDVLMKNALSKAYSEATAEEES